MTPEKNIEYHGSGNVFPRLALAVFMTVSSVSCTIHDKVVGVNPYKADNPTGMPQVPKTGPIQRVRLDTFTLKEILSMTPKQLATFPPSDFRFLDGKSAFAISQSKLFDALSLEQRMAVLHKAVFGGENEENAEVD